MIEVTASGVMVEPADQALAARAMETAFSFEGRIGAACILFATEDGIRTLNRDYRGIDRVTDVLTFPTEEGDALTAPPDGYLGDVAICLARAREQAIEYGHSLSREIAFLSVHGALHLLGYDHINPDEEMRMRQRQREILCKLELER